MNSITGMTKVFTGLLICGFTALSAMTSLRAEDAVTVKEPNAVCPNDEFEVEWTGPDGPGDLIMISNLDDPPGVETWDFAETSEGNPVTLTAPNQPGHYKKRYFEAGPQSILEEGDLEVIPCGTTACNLPDYPPDEYAVVVHAVQSSSGTQYHQPGGFSLKDLCAGVEAVVPMISGIITRAEAPLGLPTTAIQANINDQIENARKAICDMEGEGPSSNWATFVYSHCRLAGQTAAHSMDIHVPPGMGDGTMMIADHAEQQVIKGTLKRNLNLAYQGTGTGWSSDIQMKQVGAGSKLGYETVGYEFEYQMGMGIPGLGEMTTSDLETMDPNIQSPQFLGNFASVDISGTAWLAQCIPGIDIVQSYHNKLTRELQPYDGSLGAFGGIVQNQVAMLEHGMPLDITSNTTGKVAGMPMMSSTDRNVVVGFDLIEMPDGWCSQSLMPADYEVIDIDQQVNQTLTDAGMSAPDAQGTAEMNQAMEQMNQALEQLTPEQRKMMEQFGLGSMMQQANPAGQPAAAPAGSAGGATSRSGPSSADLTTDNLTQSVQNHLQALGYSVGNTNGELTTETVIAISQFQAENGMEVTGEVTPQLLGILGAKVDSR